MARWVIEATSMGGSLLLNHSPFGLSSALIMMFAVVAMLSIVLGMCAQLHSRVQNKEASDEEMSAASRADSEQGEPGGCAKGGGAEGGHGKKCSGGGTEEQGTKCINMSFGNSTKRLLSKRGPQDHDDNEDVSKGDDDVVGALGVESEPVWKRSILMGERCEPPAFSGLILYDEHGNLVQDLPWRSPRYPTSPSLRQLLTST